MSYFHTRCLCGGKPVNVLGTCSDGKVTMKTCRVECDTCGLSGPTAYCYDDPKGQAFAKWRKCITEGRKNTDKYIKDANETLQGEL